MAERHQNSKPPTFVLSRFLPNIHQFLVTVIRTVVKSDTIKVCGGLIITLLQIFHTMCR